MSTGLQCPGTFASAKAFCFLAKRTLSGLSPRAQWHGSAPWRKPQTPLSHPKEAQQRSLLDVRPVHRMEELGQGTRLVLCTAARSSSTRHAERCGPGAVRLQRNLKSKSFSSEPWRNGGQSLDLDRSYEFCPAVLEGSLVEPIMPQSSYMPGHGEPH